MIFEKTIISCEVIYKTLQWKHVFGYINKYVNKESSSFLHVLAPVGFFGIILVTTKKQFSIISDERLTEIDRILFMVPDKNRFQISSYKTLFVQPNLKDRIYRPTPSKFNRNPLSPNPTEWSNTLKQSVGFCRRIVGVCLTFLWGQCLKG